MNRFIPEKDLEFSKEKLSYRTAAAQVMKLKNRNLRLSFRPTLSKRESISSAFISIAIVTLLLVYGWAQMTAGGNNRREPSPVLSPIQTTENEQRDSNNNTMVNASKVRLVKNGREVGKGPISRIDTTIGGIRLGDSQKQVLAILGEPTERSQARGTPYPLWYYRDKDLYVQFYRMGENEAPGGAVSIRIQEHSPLKLNDRRTASMLEIGDNLERLLEVYHPIGGTAENGSTRNFWIRGSELAQNGFYKPVIHIMMKEDRIVIIGMENEDEDPNPGRRGLLYTGEAPRAQGESRYGQLVVLPDGTEQIELLGSYSCLGRETDYRFEASYRAYFLPHEGTRTSLSAEPIPALIYPSLETIPLGVLEFDDFEAFYFIPAYSDCHGVSFYLYGVHEEEAFPFRFELKDGNATNTFYVLPSTKPTVVNNDLITYGGGGAGHDGFLRYTFRPDLESQTMRLVGTEAVMDIPQSE